MNVPQHVAIIMDGNGRWAKNRGLIRAEGHKEGLNTAERIIEFSIQKGVRYLSLYVFSTENWKRPKAEVKALFALAEKYLNKLADFCANRIRVVISGEKYGIPKNLVKKMEEIQQKTESFGGICVNLCINYGGRTDICQAVKRLVAEGDEITEENLARRLYNSFLPDPDVIIRTGGCVRLSNFLLFQSAYSELFFTETLWPDFSNDEYNTILEKYGARKRNFGALPKER